MLYCVNWIYDMMYHAVYTDKLNIEHTSVAIKLEFLCVL